jgi:hypothetical protein
LLGAGLGGDRFMGTALRLCPHKAIGLSLTLGLVGFFSGWHPELLQSGRIGLGVAGLLGLAAQAIRRVLVRASD